MAITTRPATRITTVIGAIANFVVSVVRASHRQQVWLSVAGLVLTLVVATAYLLIGALRVTRAFAPLLVKSKAPRVINVSSSGGELTGGADGWSPAYCISKTALNGVTSQLAAALPKFAVNSVCPGWVRTDMGGENASRSVEEGSDTIVWLTSESPQDLTGKFLRDRKEIPW